MALASPSFHMVRGASKNDCYQCLVSQDELQLPLASPRGSLRSANRSKIAFSQFSASALGPEVCEALCGLFKNNISRDFPGCPVVKNLPCKEHRFNS